MSRRGPGAVRSAYYILFGGYTLVTLVAFLWIFNVSMKSNKEFLGTGPWAIAETFRWSNYGDAWRIAHIGTYFWNSVIVTVSSTVLALAVSVLAAYPLARIRFRLRNVAFTFFVLAIMVPWVMIFVPLYEILNWLGLIDSLLGLILVYATFNIPFNLFVLTSFLKTLPYELEEAASIDGATPGRAFFTIIMPLTGPGLAAVAVISFLNNWNEFFYALVLVHSPDKMTLPLGMFTLGQAAEYGTNWVTLFAGMMIAVVPVLLVFMVLQRQFMRGLAEGYLKS